MLLFCKVIDLGWLVFIVDAALPSESFNVCDLIDGEIMSFVDGGTVELLGSCDGLLWRLVFDESIAEPDELASLPFKKGESYPSVIPFSLTGMKKPSSFTFPALFSNFTKYFISFGLLSSGTTGSPSATTKASRPCSSRTSYCSLRSGDKTD